MTHLLTVAAYWTAIPAAAVVIACLIYRRPS